MQTAADPAAPAKMQSSRRHGQRPARTAHWLLILAAMALSALFIGVPIAVIFTYALREGSSVSAKCSLESLSQPPKTSSTVTRRVTGNCAAYFALMVSSCTRLKFWARMSCPSGV